MQAARGRSVHVERVTATGPEVHVHGWARNLDRTSFGITGSRGMVGRHLDLELDVVATLIDADDTVTEVSSFEG